MNFSITNFTEKITKSNFCKIDSSGNLLELNVFIPVQNQDFKFFGNFVIHSSDHKKMALVLLVQDGQGTLLDMPNYLLQFKAQQSEELGKLNTNGRNFFQIFYHNDTDGHASSSFLPIYEKMLSETDEAIQFCDYPNRCCSNAEHGKIEMRHPHKIGGGIGVPVI